MPDAEYVHYKGFVMPDPEYVHRFWWSSSGMHYSVLEAGLYLRYIRYLRRCKMGLRKAIRKAIRN